MAALFPIRSVTTREELRKTQVLLPNFTVNLMQPLVLSLLADSQTHAHISPYFSASCFAHGPC